MNATIIGLDHELQTSAQRTFSSDDLPAAEAKDKQWYRALLESAARQSGVVLLAEEWLTPSATIARDVATELKLGHVCVDMGPDERQARGIPVDYAINPTISADQRDAWHRAREEFMAQGVVRAAGDRGDVVIICGLQHVNGIANCLERLGHRAEQLRVNKALGFDLRWLSSNLGGHDAG